MATIGSPLAEHAVQAQKPMPTEKKAFHIFLRDTRVSVRRSIPSICKGCSVSRGVYEQWETGELTPTKAEYGRLVKQLPWMKHCQPDEFYDPKRVKDEIYKKELAALDEASKQLGAQEVPKETAKETVVAKTEPNTFGAALKQVREEAELTLVTLGELMGVSHSTVFRWENNLAVPAIGKYYDLVSLFPKLKDGPQPNIPDLFWVTKEAKPTEPPPPALPPTPPPAPKKPEVAPAVTSNANGVVAAPRPTVVTPDGTFYKRRFRVGLRPLAEEDEERGLTTPFPELKLPPEAMGATPILPPRPPPPAPLPAPKMPPTPATQPPLVLKHNVTVPPRPAPLAPVSVQPNLQQSEELAEFLLNGYKRLFGGGWTMRVEHANEGDDYQVFLYSTRSVRHTASAKSIKECLLQLKERLETLVKVRVKELEEIRNALA